MSHESWIGQSWSPEHLKDTRQLYREHHRSWKNVSQVRVLWHTVLLNASQINVLKEHESKLWLLSPFQST